MRHAEPAHADQASGLRRLLAPRRPRLVALTGSAPAPLAALADALAGALERTWGRVLLLDLSRGTLAAAAGRAGRYELMHVIDHCRSLEQVFFEAPSGVRVLPAARGARALAAEPDGAARFAGIVAHRDLSPQLTLALVPPDQLGVLAGLAGAPHVLLALTQGTARELTDAYGVLKRVRALGGTVHVVVDGLPAAASDASLARLHDTARTFLGHTPAILGRLAGTAPVDGARAGGRLDHDALAHAVLAWPIPEPARAAQRIAVPAFAHA